jgi:SAM-dependent methyltransferase
LRNLGKLSRDIALKFDHALGTNVKEGGGKVYRYFLQRWSRVRRILDPISIRLRYKIGKTDDKDLRLHLGCGWKHFDGYVNVDLWITDATDIISDITSLPWPDNAANIIESYHVIEHISHKKIKKTLTDWHRVLKPGGKLILECPHFDVAIQEYLSGDESRLLNIFGRQRSEGDAHLYGFNPERLMRLLEEVGFKEIQEAPPQSSQILDEPSFRLECKKGE